MSDDGVEDERNVKDDSKVYFNIVIPPVNFWTVYRLFFCSIYSLNI